MQAVYIYGLYDPRNNELRYIGKSKNPKQRFFEHINTIKNGEVSSKADWIRELIDKGYIPLLKTLEKTDEFGWEEAEKRWIAESRIKGLNLLNVADGGNNPPDWLGRKQSVYHIKKRVEARQAKGNYVHNAETRKKISEHRKGKAAGSNNGFYGKQHSEEAKKRIYKNHKEMFSGENNPFFGKHHSNETKEKISKSRKGKFPSEEAKKKMSEARKGQKVTLETRKKLSLANSGKHISEATKEKLRQANLGKHHSEETRKKISLLSKGRHHSEETRQKMKISNKGRKFSEEQNKQNSQRTKSLWQNPEYRTKMAEAQKKRREREAKEKGAGQC